MPFPKYFVWMLFAVAPLKMLWAQTATISDSVKASALYNEAFDFLQSNPDKALEKAAELKLFSATAKYPNGIAMALNVEGNALRAKGDYLGATNKHFEALTIFDSLKNKSGYRSTLVNTGSDYSALKNYPKAIEYFRKALTLTDAADYTRQVVILNNIGNAYQIMGLLDSAMAAYQRAKPFADADTTGSLRAFLYASIAIIYGERGDFKNAIPYMQQAIQAQLKIGDKSHYAGSLSTLAGFYIELKEYKKAIYYLDEAYKTAIEIGSKSVIANYYRNKAHLLWRTGNYKDAYTVLDKFIFLNDSLINERHVTEQAESEARFGLETKNRELALLNIDKALKESELKRQIQWRYALLGILGALAVAMFFLFRTIQLKRKANKNLIDENSQMQKENILAQYETLRNQVNPHFLFNSLNALSSLIKQNPEKALEFAGVFSRLYRNVLELKDHTVITLAEELRLVDDFMYLQKIRFEDKLMLQKNIPAQLLNYFIPPFCIQMLIENAIKHNIISEEQNLNIKLFVVDNWLVVSNSLQPRPQKNESTGVGIKNINARFKIIHNLEPQFYVFNNEYIAKIPLINPSE